MQYNNMRESEEKHDPKWQWALFILCALVFTCGIIGVVSFVDSGSSSSSADLTAAKPAEIQTSPLSATQMCGTCEEVPGVSGYTLCRTCWIPMEEDVKIRCRSNEKPVIEHVKLGGGRELPENAVRFAYESCLSNGVDGASFMCSFNLKSISDKTTSVNEAVQGEEIEDSSVWDWTFIFGHPRNHVQVNYVCFKTPMLQQSAVQLFPEEESYPILSSALMKCGSLKSVYEGWDKGMACASTSGDSRFTITCNQDTDVRLLVHKMDILPTGSNPVVLSRHGQHEQGKHGQGKHGREKGHHHDSQAKKLVKRVATLCDGEFQNSSTCTFSIQDLYTSGETVQEGEYSIKYVCSYPTLIVV